MRRYKGVNDVLRGKFQFTHPGRGATRYRKSRPGFSRVSIHAPREGCDREKPRGCHSLPSFNSRTPGGVRLTRTSPLRRLMAFQFTHPGRGATLCQHLLCELESVSIHAPREGCDSALCLLVRMRYSFNSRTPGGVRLRGRTTLAPLEWVSIHAPREGCDVPKGVRLTIP